MRGSFADIPKTVDVDELTIREVDWGGMRASLIKCHQTLDISPAMKGLPDDMCQCPHWGMIIKGRKVVKYKDRTEVLKSGDAYYIEPGHTTVTDAGTEWLEFSPIVELKKQDVVVSRNLAAMGKA